MALHNWFIPHQDTHKKAHLISWEALIFYILIFILLQVSFSIVGFIKPGILGISSNVRFLGYVSDDDQQKIYKIADVYVMPSTSEPFGITALEAMSSGVPVIISKTSGVAEIVKSAIKVDFWDINAMAMKILAVLKHAPLSRAMVRLSSHEVAYYTWAKTAEETLKVYHETMARVRENKA